MFATTLESLVARHAPARACAVALRARTGSVVVDRQAPASVSQSQRPQPAQAAATVGRQWYAGADVPATDALGRRAGRPWCGAGPSTQPMPVMPALRRCRPANGLPGATKGMAASHAGRSHRASGQGTAIR